MQKELQKWKEDRWNEWARKRWKIEKGERKEEKGQGIFKRSYRSQVDMIYPHTT